MADLDAELLALAGGDDSSGEEDSSPPSPPQRRSPSRQSSSSSEKDTADMSRKGIAQPVKKSRARKPARRAQYSEDEGEE
jgi:RNA polymerase-associated protein RTF1